MSTLPTTIPNRLRPNLEFSDDIRPWPVPQLMADAQAAISQIPAGAEQVLVGHVATKDGQFSAGLVYMRRVGEKWTAVMRTDWTPGEDLSASVMIVKAY